MLIIKKFNKQIHVWLISLILLVGSIIIVGGLTRLTNSGLSIIEWELFTGIFPPVTFEEWIIYFKLYQSIPQFEYVNSMMTLDEFKVIFLWEYSHRLLARFIGLFFIIPFLFFLYKKILSNEYRYKLSIIFILILLQGIVGWYMVKSGLVYNISVSHYRLSMHLFIAFIIFSSLLWMYLNFSRKKNKKFFLNHTKVSSLKLLIFLIYIQIIMGAFVSGLDAGKIYQTWPLMNNNYFPNDTTLNNFFNLNQPSTVQFLHRNIAYIIFFLSVYIGFNILKKKNTYQYKYFFFFFLVILTQIGLGIFVLISGVNIYLASMHQISSIFLVITVLKLYHSSIRS